MKQEIKWILIILGIIIAWAILSGNLDLGNLFSTTPATPTPTLSGAGEVGEILR